jgi:CPA2 family monovalent cation:H+ antiporter-2
VLGGAIVSILLNPLLFVLAARYGRPAPAPAAPAPEPAPEPEETDLVPTTLTGHSVVVGHGTVGGPVAAGLRADGAAVLVVELDAARVAAARAAGLEAIAGHACAPEVLAAANLAAASRLVIAIPDEMEAGQVAGQARALHPALPILARADTAAAEAHLRACGASLVVSAPREVAATLLAAARAPA